MIKLIKLYCGIALMLMTISCSSLRSDGVITVDSSWKIAVSNSSDPLIIWAADQLATDISEILNSRIEVVDLDSNTVLGENIIVIGSSKSIDIEKQLALSIDGKWESFYIEDRDERINIIGSDVRGTVYGIFELAERMGVSPWKWWADVKPIVKSSIDVSIDNSRGVETPSVQYRGIFINDEDWGLQPWAKETFEPEVGDIGPRTYEKIFQLLLRLKANTIWPAMHPCTTAFYNVEGNNDMAKRYNIVVGTSHCEPMLRNNVDEWNHDKYGEFNYFVNREGVDSYWRERITQVNSAENIVTLGMRGIHDGHMYGGNSIEEKVKMVETIIDNQREMLSDIKKKPLNKIATTVVLYKEVLDLYNSGLNIPEDVTIMWCDDNHGYIRRLSNKQEQKRCGRSGVYYHLSYWGNPHDYLWLNTTAPGLVWYEMNRAYQNGADKIWIANVGDIKPSEYSMELFLDMAWNIDEVNNQTLDNHLKSWAVREFGEICAEDITEIMSGYYQLASIRRPEFMGWSGVEPQTEIVDTEFNTVEDIELRLQKYKGLEELVSKVKIMVPKERLDAYFELVEYPVVASSAMNRKFLLAQRARAERDVKERLNYADGSVTAFESIKTLTDRYNLEIAEGKWSGVMDYKPRNLPVFKMPDTTFNSNSEEIISGYRRLSIPADSFSKAVGTDNYNWNSIEQLGHSGSAVTLMPMTINKFEAGEEPYLEYNFTAEESGEFYLHLHLLPNHVNDRDQVVTVTINSITESFSISTTGRSKKWKENTLRNYVKVKMRGEGDRGDNITVKVAVNQTGVVIDQLGVTYSDKDIYYSIEPK